MLKSLTGSPSVRALTDNTTPRCCDAFSQFSWLDTLRMMFFVGILLKCGVTTNSLGSSPQKFTPPLHPSGLYVRVGYKYGLVVPLFTHSHSLIGPTSFPRIQFDPMPSFFRVGPGDNQESCETSYLQPSISARGTKHV